MVKSELDYMPTASTMHFCIINLTLQVLTVKQIEIKMENHKTKTIDEQFSEIFAYIKKFFLLVFSIMMPFQMQNVFS